MTISAVKVHGAHKNPFTKATIKAGLSGGDGPVSSLVSKATIKAGLSGGDGPLSTLPRSMEKAWSQRIQNGLSGGDGPVSSLVSKTAIEAGLSGGDGPVSSLSKPSTASTWFKMRQNIQNGLVPNLKDLIDKNADARNPVA